MLPFREPKIRLGLVLLRERDNMQVDDGDLFDSFILDINEVMEHGSTLIFHLCVCTRQHTRRDTVDRYAAASADGCRWVRGNNSNLARMCQCL